MIFQRQRLRVGEILNDAPLSDAAFRALSEAGSCAGYYLRARSIAPDRPETGEMAGPEEQKAARAAADYLWDVYNEISLDDRCLQLLLSCEWISTSGRWLFRGQRQPLPIQRDDRVKLRSILLAMMSSSPDQIQSRYRYLEAVLNWLTDDEVAARRAFRDLARDTEYVEQGRVILRHVLTDEKGEPRRFQGVVEKQIGEKRWSVFIEEISRHVDMVQRDLDTDGVAIGRTIRNFSVAFNYLGAIADLYHARSRRR